MITQRSRRLVEVAERYAIAEAELIDIIRDCVCEYYSIDMEKLSSSLRKRPYSAARERYFMVAINSTMKTSYHKVSKTVDRSHCMVVIAKRKVLEIEQGHVWNAVIAKEYDELNDMIIARILSTREPVEAGQKSFLTELAGIMDTLKSSGKEDVEMNSPKDKLLNILSMVYTAEKKGHYPELIKSLSWVMQDKLEA